MIRLSLFHSLSCTTRYSLIDQLEKVFRPLMVRALGGNDDNDDNNSSNYNVDDFLRRIDGGRKLRIGLTDRRVFPPFLQNPRAYRYADQYRDLDDVLAVALSSAYVPGLTGPLGGSNNHNKNDILSRLVQPRIQEMLELGYIKDGTTHCSVSPSSLSSPSSSSLIRSKREIFWDGGLVNLWPTIDNRTLLVTPMTVAFHPNPFISPALDQKARVLTSNDDNDDDNDQDQESLFKYHSNRRIKLNNRTQLILSPMDNIATVRRMLLSSDTKSIEQRYQQGYDNTR